MITLYNTYIIYYYTHNYNIIILFYVSTNVYLLHQLSQFCHPVGKKTFHYSYSNSKVPALPLAIEYQGFSSVFFV